MSVAAVTFVFAVLAVLAQVFVVAAAALWLASRSSGAAARVFSAARDLVRGEALALALVVAAVATAGSLYLSQVAHFVPCRLCWVQRGLMYPLVPILAGALWHHTEGVRRVALPISALGASVSTYHVLLERFPMLESRACDPKNPCSLIWIKRFGYLTIPTMALSAFALIITLLALPAHQPAPVQEF